MKRLLCIAAALLLSSCAKRTNETGATDASVTIGDAESKGPELVPRVSLPFGAVRSHDGSFLVAGYSVPQKSIAVYRADREGKASWQKEILAGTKWTEDAFTRWFADGAGGGVLIAMTDKGRKAVRVKSDGTIADPVAISGTYCATGDNLVWVDAKRRVQSMALATGASSTLGVLPEGREPRLVCARSRAFVVGDGEEDVSLLVPKAGVNAPYERVFSDADFKGEELRDTFEFATARDIGVIRIGMAGTIAIREKSGEALLPIHKWTSRLAEDDVVVDVEGTEKTALLVVTHEEDGHCGDASIHMATRVSALRFDRLSKKEESLALAPATCDRELGPFWTDVVGDAIVVSWVERAPTPQKTDAPIVALSFVAVRPNGISELQHISLRADGAVNAGCSQEGCDVVALVREPGATVMAPEAVHAFHFAP